MRGHVAFSRIASADLREMAAYIAKDNRPRAITFARELIRKCEGLVHQPLAYPLREDVAPGLRQALYGRYRILFRVNRAGKIRIIRIVHGARDVSRLFIERP